jgi:hypothetical protein
LLDIYVSALYCAKLIRKEISPRLATWLIFEIGVLMSLVAYLTSHDHSLVKVALNAADAVLVTMILVLILVKQRDTTVRFTSNERLCLVLAFIATAAWIWTRTGWTGVVGFQLVLTVAYFPTIESVWKWKPGRSPEPVEKWSINAVIALIGVFTDLAGRHDYLALMYPLRALVLCVIVAALIVRWGHKNEAAAGFTAR